jgi:hypothetical protein
LLACGECLNSGKSSGRRDVHFRSHPKILGRRFDIEYWHLALGDQIMTSTRFNLKRIDLHVPQYSTDASIIVNESHSSGRPHLETTYAKEPPNGHQHVAAAIPDDWTDSDILELISLPARKGTGRDWPSWEIPASDHASPWLFRFWKGEKPPAN